MTVNKYRVSILILAVLFLLNANNYAQNNDIDVNSVKVQITSFEKRLSTEQNIKQYTKLKNDLSLSIEALKACENKSSVELDELSKLYSESVPDKTEQAKAEGLKAPDFKLMESKLQKRLFECKYWLLKAGQIRERTMKLLSIHQISDYLKPIPIYWNEDFKSQPIAWSANLQVIFIFTLLFMFLQVGLNYLIFKKNQWFGQVQYIIAALLTLGISSIALSYVKQAQIVTDTGHWLILASFLITYAAILYGRLLPIIYAAIAVLLSVLLIEPATWQFSKYIHLLIISSTIMILYLIERAGKSRGYNLFYGSVLILTGVIELGDYHALSHQLLKLIFILHIFAQLYRVVKDSVNNLFEYVNTSKNPLLVKFRRMLNVSKQSKIPGLALVRWTLSASLMALVFLSLIEYSGVSEAITETVQSSFKNGFYIGTIRINFQNILVASLILGLLIIMSSIIRRKIELAGGKENSAQTAKAALFWYGAVLTSILTALSVSGFNVQNLALIAGAFSVGIGFGLQNIVSNFVSGIILLIERPVKPGDWIIIGTTEGIVKEINIRATRVLTFDKSDILIPNTEFISNQVTNLTLGDNVGRLRFSLGVAYGSDTDKVHKILSDIVSQQHGVINDDDDYASDIVFRQFGDSSLEFEIRCYLNDIRSIIQIRSELHFEIDKQFRLAKIEIPFPQRDIHIKTSDKQTTSGLNLPGEAKDD